MPQLHLTKADGSTEVIGLNDGETFLGREPGCDIQLAYAGISRQHLRLVTVMGDTFLEDLGSRNGTYVNGRLARKCALRDGDVLQIGEIELRFERDAPSPAGEAPQDPDATTVLTPGQFGPQSLAAREAGLPVEGISPVAELSDAATLHPIRTHFDDQSPRDSWWSRLWSWLRR